MAKIKVTVDGILEVEDGAIQKMYGIEFVANVKRNKKNEIENVSFIGEAEEEDIQSLLDAKLISKAKGAPKKEQ